MLRVKGAAPAEGRAAIRKLQKRTHIAFAMFTGSQRGCVWLCFRLKDIAKGTQRVSIKMLSHCCCCCCWDCLWVVTDSETPVPDPHP